MQRTFCFVCGILLMVIFIASSMPVAPVEAFQTTSPVYQTASTQYGVFAVNQTTGAITFCANSTIVPSTGGQQPIGVCKSVGTVAPTTGNPNSLAMTVSGPSSVFVYNVVNGAVAQCAGSGVQSGTTVTPVASCKALPKLT